ncbi:hypothetical protein GWK47_014738 [Chionoecetes opilio]|uniref:Uncharacterized protein n=1 Tax=Chionoecetes opilio TaxID=41210 RepID=A0A8J4Y3H2_CHIOP|nr:hypothetical protein GWK47_014738 [Chionoecetes opilio]
MGLRLVVGWYGGVGRAASATCPAPPSRELRSTTPSAQNPGTGVVLRVSRVGAPSRRCCPRGRPLPEARVPRETEEALHSVGSAGHPTPTSVCQPISRAAASLHLTRRLAKRQRMATPDTDPADTRRTPMTPLSYAHSSHAHPPRPCTHFNRARVLPRHAASINLHSGPLINRNPAYQPKNWSQGKEENTTFRRTSQDQDPPLLSTSLPHIGPKLFNNLPGKLRNLTECSVEKFKHHLDNHLQTIPDEPPVPGYTSVSRADTNSISDQVNLQHRDAGFGCSGGAPRL